MEAITLNNLAIGQKARLLQLAVKAFCAAAF